MSELSFDGHGDNRHEAKRRQLLAMHVLRHHLERGEVAVED
jgi:hypothetical protein